MPRSTVDICNQALGRIGEQPISDLDESSTPAESCKRLYEECLRQTLERFLWPFAVKQSALTVAYAEYSESTIYALGDVVRYDQILYTSLAAANTGNALTDATKWQKTKPFGVGWEYVYNLPDGCITPLALLYQGQRRGNMQLSENVPFSLCAKDGGVGMVLLTDYEWDVDFDALEYVGLPGTVDGDGNWVDDPRFYPALFVDAVAWLLASRLALELKKDLKTAAEFEKRHEAAIDKAAVQMMNAQQRDPDPLTPSLVARG